MRTALIIAVAIIVLQAVALVILLAAPAAVTMHQQLPCEHCNATGLVDCPRCEAGWIVDDAGHAVPCHRCAGARQIACTWCDGRGYMTEF